MTHFFIDRPIFATVLSIIITLAGMVGVSSLPVAQYPEITPPTVEVYTVYPGANARVVADTVAAPIEQQVNGVEEMMYMSSQCTNDGTYTLTVTFKPGVDLNVAQVLVQNRVNLAQPVLPDLVKRRGVTVKKKSPSQLMIINLYSPDGSRDNLYLSNYATIYLRDELARLPGVGDITFLGQRDYSMRLWLDPEKLASRGLAGAEVVTAIEQQNAQVPAGQVGQPPAPTGQAFQYTINTLGRLAIPEQFSDVVLKADDSGRVVRVKDVSRSELGALAYDQTCTLDGRPSVALSVYQLPGSNALETARKVKARVEELKQRFPHGLEYDIVYDTTPFIEESIEEVFKTLRDAVILVAVVMLVFLQSWRAAIIPLAAVPVAIVGTFAAMIVLGYSINNLTLFGLVLAVGIVVDDAIVVVEAVQHHVEGGLSPRLATAKAMDEVAGPVVAVGLVLTAVFVPCVFISGIVGQFYRQFAVTIAVSTLISTFNSLTLSPALCALLLKPKAAGEEKEPLPRVVFPLLGAAAAYFFLTGHVGRWVALLPPQGQGWLAPAAGWLVPAVAGGAGGAAGYFLRVVLNRALGWTFAGFNVGFDAVTAWYIRVVGVTLRVGPLVLLGYGGLLYLTYVTMTTTPTGFIPQQDKGYLLVNVQLPDAASVDRTNRVMRQLDGVAREMPGVSHTLTVSGQSVLLGANAPNFGTLYVMLDRFSDRLAPDRHADAIAARLQETFNDRVPGAAVNVFGAPPVDGLGTAGGFKMVVLDPSGVGATDLEEAGRQLVTTANETAELRDTFTGFRADTPWLFLDINRVAAQSRGVPVGEIITTLQVYLGSLYVNDFNQFGRTWQVNVQAESRFRQSIADVLRLKVKTTRGEMVPIKEFLKNSETTGPVMVQRYNLYPAVAVNTSPAPGVSSGQAIGALERTAAEQVPPTMRSEWTELALLQLQTKDTAARAFILSVVLVFLVLAAQYESWALPLAVILVVPMCLLSAVIGVRAAGQDINIFTQIGFVVLVGLACKNAILIVEFAKQRREAGADARAATLEACALRLRPIVMTSVAFIIGVVPLVLAEGAGAEMRHALGTAVFAGMVGVTAFGIFLTPVFFLTIQRVKDLYTARRATDEPAA
ncbi:MAG: cation/multidrug efflux pump [Gemmataceae bacterium]|nr:cation/multidrug efflux pump [Gemmataceae bacterium]